MPPLTGEGFLLCLAQVGLAFAGFSGIILTMRQDPNRTWLLREIVGLKFVLEHSFATALFSLCPFIIYYWFKSEQHVWQISNAILATFLGFQCFSQISRIKDTNKMGDKPAYPKALVVFYIIPTAILFIIEITRIRNGSLGWYGFGLLYLLIQGAIQFWIFLIIYTQARLQHQTQNDNETKETA